MKVFVGLGNPGTKHAGNRHNIGFMALDRIAADHGFGPWRTGFKAELAEGRLGAGKVLLVKPQTFMNLSGEAVRAAKRAVFLAVLEEEESAGRCQRGLIEQVRMEVRERMG